MQNYNNPIMENDVVKYFETIILEGHLDPLHIDIKIFPDWVLNLLVFDENNEPTQYLATVAIFLFSVAEAAKKKSRHLNIEEKEIVEVIYSFGLACTFERLRRSGHLKDYEITDIFDGNIKSKFTLPDWVVDSFKSKN